MLRFCETAFPSFSINSLKVCCSWSFDCVLSESMFGIIVGVSLLTFQSLDESIRVFELPIKGTGSRIKFCLIVGIQFVVVDIWFVDLGNRFVVVNMWMAVVEIRLLTVGLRLVSVGVRLIVAGVWAVALVGFWRGDSVGNPVSMLCFVLCGGSLVVWLGNPCQRKLFFIFPSFSAESDVLVVLVLPSIIVWSSFKSMSFISLSATSASFFSDSVIGRVLISVASNLWLISLISSSGFTIFKKFDVFVGTIFSIGKFLNKFSKFIFSSLILCRSSWSFLSCFFLERTFSWSELNLSCNRSLSSFFKFDENLLLNSVDLFVLGLTFSVFPSSLFAEVLSPNSFSISRTFSSNSLSLFFCFFSCVATKFEISFSKLSSSCPFVSLWVKVFIASFADICLTNRFTLSFFAEPIPFNVLLSMLVFFFFDIS